MSRLLVSIVGAFALLCIAFAVAGVAHEEGGPKPVPDVQLLLKRLEALEARVAELEQRRATVVLSEAQVPEPVGRELPKGWRKKEFNGIPYYIVPLQSSTDRER